MRAGLFFCPRSRGVGDPGAGAPAAPSCSNGIVLTGVVAFAAGLFVEMWMGRL